jgi:glycine/D-amino acid oxidase-like deaminating enzyme
VAVSAPAFVSAAGPLQGAVAALLGVELPLHNELHLKASFNDHLGVVPRHAPMLIWNDPLRLPWGADEREALADDPELRYLLEPLPAGAHCRPEGGLGASTLLMLWDYHTGASAPTFPIRSDPQLPELALRGLSTMLPGLAAYLGRLPQTYIDGGYYTRTRENRPIVGPLPIAGAFVIGGLSGFGLMASCGAGELVAAHVLGAALPSYAPDLALARYADPAYLARLEAWGADGQL